MTEREKPRRIFSYPLPPGTDPARLFAPHAEKPFSLFFDSNRPSHPSSHYSYLCVDPFERIDGKDGTVTITNGINRYSYKADPFLVVRERLNHYGEFISQEKSLPPFQGGAAGFFGYDIARGIERLPSTAKTNPSMPDFSIGLYDCIAAFDHRSGKSWIIVTAPDEKTARERAKIFKEDTSPPAFSPADISWQSPKDDNSFKNDIGKAIDYIYAGDIFQVNLSRRFTADLSEDFNSYAHYCNLRKINSAPYSSFMNFGSVTLSGSSPESFLSVRGGTVTTKPIKGTMPSSHQPDDLLNSEKDKAENAMIVDLLRNDLSKACDDHSIEVESLFSLETFEGLHHLVSTVTGTLRADKSAFDLLRACFPGGSITGAPKIRAMEIIEEMEPERRGPYCGVMGHFGWNGDAETNIIIRTLVYSNGTVQLQTGGGITAESDPEKELQETLTKAQKLFDSFHKIAAEDKAA